MSGQVLCGRKDQFFSFQGISGRVLYGSENYSLMEGHCHGYSGPYDALPFLWFGLCLTGRGIVVQTSERHHLAETIEPGCIILTPHDCRGSGEWPKCHCLGFGIYANAAERFVHAATGSADIHWTSLASKCHRSALLREGLLAIRRDALNGTLNDRSLTALVSSGLVDLVLTANGEERTCARSSTSLTPAKLKRVCEMIDSNLAGGVRVADLARSASLSRSHFARAFRAATGRSPQDYLQERRLSEAIRLLETTERPITDIAFALGFSSPSALAHGFRRRFGSSPTAWRRTGR